jgi:hypothetical protein
MKNGGEKVNNAFCQKNVEKFVPGHFENGFLAFVLIALLRITSHVF